MPDRTPVSPAESPINALADPLTHPGDTRFDRWWHERLAAYRTAITDLMVKIDDPHQLSRTEQQALAKRMRNSNMALYRCRHPARVDRAAVQALALQLGLCEPDHNLCAADDGFSPKSSESRHPLSSPPHTSYHTKHAISAHLIITSEQACSETVENEAKIL